MSTTETRTPAEQAIAGVISALAETVLPGVTIEHGDRPALHAGHLHLGLVAVGDDVDVVVLNSDAGNRSVRHFTVGRDDEALVAAVVTFARNAGR